MMELNIILLKISTEGVTFLYKLTYFWIDVLFSFFSQNVERPATNLVFEADGAPFRDSTTDFVWL